MIEVIPPVIPVRAGLTAGVKGEYLPYIVNPDGSEEYPLGKEWIPNIITNIGLERLLTGSSTIISTSSNNPYITDSTFTRPGSAPFGALVWARVGSGTTAATKSDTQLESQLTDPAPTSVNFTGSGGNLTDQSNANSNGTVTHKWTKQFSSVSGSVAINEIAMGWASTGNNTIFSRVVLPSTLNLTTGQILRVSYQLTISCPQFLASSSVSGLSSGSFDLAGTSPAGGLKIIGTATEVFGNLNSLGVFPLSNGQAHGNLYGFLAMREESAGAAFTGMVLTTGTTFGTVTPIAGSATGTMVSRSVTGGSAVDSPYVDAVWKFSVSQPADTVTNVSGFALERAASFVRANIIQCLFDNPQTKSNEFELSIGLRGQWARL